MDNFNFSDIQTGPESWDILYLYEPKLNLPDNVWRSLQVFISSVLCPCAFFLNEFCTLPHIYIHTHIHI